MKCPRCGYDWESKIPNPKECPRCKARLDYEAGPVGAPRIGKKGGGKEMTSKLSWATAAILIIAAVAVGTWAIMGTPPVETPPPPPPPTYGALTVGSSNAVFTGADVTTTGIENVYIIKHTVTVTGDEIPDNSDNLGGNAVHENVVLYGTTPAIITATTVSVNVPINTYFDIVVAFRVDNDNVIDVNNTAGLGYENFSVHIVCSSAYTFSDNTTMDNMFCIENDAALGTDWTRWNAVFNNGGAGFVLSGGTSMSLDNIDLNIWAW